MSFYILFDFIKNQKYFFLLFINILPIPGLDGGHALISIIEGVIGRKLPSKIKMSIQSVGMLILFSLIILVIFNDIMRLI